MDEIWAVLDEQVKSARLPGYVAAVRIGDRTQVHAGGRRALGPDAAPMTADTLFRIASVTKPIGAALALSLLRDGAFALDDPISRWLPETAAFRVLRHPDADLDDTVDPVRPVTVRHLLDGTSGWGVVMSENPVQATMFARGLIPGTMPATVDGGEFVRRLAEVPLSFQPGEGWLYETGMNVLGVLIARATGRALADLLAERITGPLGMTDTAFRSVDPGRAATLYTPGPDGLAVRDPADGAFARPPLMEELRSGLVSTAGDVLRFFAAMADGGAPVLAPDLVRLMTTEAIPPRLRPQAELLTGPGGSWGLGTGVDVAAEPAWRSPGRWGWTGGAGTSAYVDPERETVAVLLTQREMTGPLDSPDGFWSAVAEAAA